MHWLCSNNTNHNDNKRRKHRNGQVTAKRPPASIIINAKQSAPCILQSLVFTSGFNRMAKVIVHWSVAEVTLDAISIIVFFSFLFVSFQMEHMNFIRFYSQLIYLSVFSICISWTMHSNENRPLYDKHLDEYIEAALGQCALRFLFGFSCLGRFYCRCCKSTGINSSHTHTHRIWFESRLMCFGMDKMKFVI